MITNVFGIAVDILNAGFYDLGRDHDATLDKVLRICRDIPNYLSEFSPATVELCEPLRKLTLVKAEWSWNRIYQDIYDKAIKVITKDACMTFYDSPKSL